jgi:two-component system sensor histidine kinase CreC
VRIGTRIFLANLVVVAIGFLFLLSWLVDDLELQYRKATEEPLVDASRILAFIAGSTVKDGEIDVDMFADVFEDVKSRTFLAKIYDFEKRAVDYKIYMTDSTGKVLFDSHDSDNVGKDFSGWNDVYLTLRGEYGTRTTRETPDDPKSSVMYVASPISVDGELAGVLSVGKPTRAANEFVEESRRKIIIGGTFVCGLVILFSMIVSGAVTRPVQKLTDYAQAVRDGRRVELPSLGRSEMGKLGAAFEEMRDALEGKKYVENYVQTLTHEIKSPLSAIRGAAELLGEGVPPEKQKRFLRNIRSETERVRAVVEKLLLLASLESKKNIEEVERLDLFDIVKDVKNDMLPILEKKRLSLEMSADEGCLFEGDRFLVRHAILNLLQNAVDFSPEEGRITAALKKKDGFIEIRVCDQGPGIPEYALEKVYGRFYSLKHPDTGKKGSGLGLSLVREVAELHRGGIVLDNAPDRGAVATLSLPVVHGESTA